MLPTLPGRIRTVGHHPSPFTAPASSPPTPATTHPLLSHPSCSLSTRSRSRSSSAVAVVPLLPLRRSFLPDQQPRGEAREVPLLLLLLLLVLALLVVAARGTERAEGRGGGGAPASPANPASTSPTRPPAPGRKPDPPYAVGELLLPASTRSKRQLLPRAAVAVHHSTGLCQASAPLSLVINHQLQHGMGTWVVAVVYRSPIEWGLPILSLPGSSRYSVGFQVSLASKYMTEAKSF